MSMTNLRRVERRTGQIRHLMDQGVPLLQIVRGVDTERRTRVDLSALRVGGRGVQRRENVDRENIRLVDGGGNRWLPRSLKQ